MISEFQKKKFVVVTDCGSTTTKGVVFEETTNGWRQTYRSEAPTTVEKPVADVTVGVTNALVELEENSKRKIIGDPIANDILYLSTSSAGGGLQMAVAGIVGGISAESAERAALGAGAIVLETISIDDGREALERGRRLRSLKPDIILIAGGTEGGNIAHPIELAETILQASPQPRFGDTLKVPVIYAANSTATEQVRKLLAEKFQFSNVANIRPKYDEENLAPARDAIHELFLSHVMSHAPGYSKLLEWAHTEIMPTPTAVGEMVQKASTILDKRILAVDIGGATTDVFSTTKKGEDYQLHRTVSANLGMSYSIAQVLLEAGVKNVKRWIPFELQDSELKNQVWNKMVRPTTIPHTLKELFIEQAVCREALRLSFIHHKKLSSNLPEKKKKGIGDLFAKDDKSYSIRDIDLIIGSGGVLSHAPDRKQSAMMLLDAFQPEGFTDLAVDSIFMLPHLGVFSTVNPAAAVEILNRDCLIMLGTTLSLSGEFKKGKVLHLEIEGFDPMELESGVIKVFKFEGERGARFVPLQNSIDLGAGYGGSIERRISGGTVGFIVDTRGRPLTGASKDNFLQMGIALAF